VSYNILVTGGAGYIGSVLVPELLKAGNKVTVLDNYMFNQNTLLDCCYNSLFSIARGDARDGSLLSETVKDKDYIIPLAALVGAPLCDKDEDGAESINTGAIKTLTEIIDPEQRIIIPITNSGYGIGEKGKFCTEETPLRPISHYGKTKVEAEKIALSRANSVSLRLATVFGASPRMRLDLLVNDFTYKAVKEKFIDIFEGHFMRNYIHIRDVAKAFLHVIDNFDKLKGEAYNVGLSDANISKLELCTKIREQLPDFNYQESSDKKDPDQRDYLVSNEKIEKTGFKPSYSLEDGITELIKTYKILSDGVYRNV
jgi:nucleoside-diphosphate-sugar epimerase